VLPMRAADVAVLVPGMRLISCRSRYRRAIHGWPKADGASGRVISTMASRSMLLRRNRSFRRLWLARVVSFLGDAMGLVALILYVADEVGSGTAVALLLLAGDFTPTLLSPLVGVVADRLERRRLLIICELGQALAAGTIVIAEPPLGPLLVLVALSGLLASLFQAAARSAVPELVADHELEHANALIGGGTYGLEAFGPLLAAVLLPFMSPLGVLAIDAVTFLVSPLLLAGLPRMPSLVRSGQHETVSAAARTGIRYIWRHRILRPVAVAFVVVVAFNGVDDVALVFLGRDTFDAGDSGVSLLYAASGLGLLLGFALVVSRATRSPPVTIAIAGFVIGSAGNLLTGVSPVIAAAFVMQLVRGIGLSLMEVGPTTLLQRTVPRQLLGRVFANLHGAIGLAAGCSYIVGGPLLDRLSPRAVLAIAGAGGVAASAILALRVHTSTGHTGVNDDRPDDDAGDP
jgi:MFS family permease